MSEGLQLEDTYLEVISPDGSRTRVPLQQTPFLVGRGEEGNHLALDDKRISRRCASIVAEGGRFAIEDRGHRLGVFVNDEKITSRVLEDNDVITFGLQDSVQVVFCSSRADTVAIQNLVSRMETAVMEDPLTGGLNKLSLLLEATSLPHSQLPIEAVLHAMLDRAITIINADRGLLFEVDATGALRPWLARRKGSTNIPPEDFSPSQTAVNLALQKHCGVITEDVHKSEGIYDSSQSIITQRLRAVVAVPLYAMPRANTDASILRARRGEFLGMLYLDSQRPAAFSKLDRQILDAIAIESASILDNARLVKRELDRQRYEQELNIARDIQQALLPREIHDYPHVAFRGINTPCHAVGGDYFDVFPIDDRRTACLIADVAGKGLGAALLTTMLQGALSGLTLGIEPSRVFQHINTFLCDHAEVGRYATMFYATLDVDGNLEYLNAGHLPPLLLRGATASELFTEGSFPIGLVPEAQYTVARARLQPGDTMVLFSDGVTEAANLRDDLFGVARLQDILAGQQALPLDQLQDRILAAVEQFTEGASPSDDLTLLLVRYRPALG